MKGYWVRFVLVLVLLLGCLGLWVGSYFRPLIWEQKGPGKAGVWSSMQFGVAGGNLHGSYLSTSGEDRPADWYVERGWLGFGLGIFHTARGIEAFTFNVPLWFFCAVLAVVAGVFWKSKKRVRGRAFPVEV